MNNRMRARRHRICRDPATGCQLTDQPNWVPSPLLLTESKKRTRDVNRSHPATSTSTGGVRQSIPSGDININFGEGESPCDQSIDQPIDPNQGSRSIDRWIDHAHAALSPSEKDPMWPSHLATAGSAFAPALPDRSPNMAASSLPGVHPAT